MKAINSIITAREPKAPPRHKIRSQRDELVQQFTDRLNETRKGTKFKPLTCRPIAIKLSHIPTDDLWAFYRQCENARSFSAYFWWAIKVDH